MSPRFPWPEEFLHFVWRHRYFETKGLRTADDQPVKILQTGLPNSHQGPDFRGAKVRIGDLEWAGQVEIHLDGADWYRHGHHEDPEYNAVVLHVALIPGPQPAIRQDGTAIPEILLKGRIPADMEARYDRLRLSQDDIACGGQLSSVPDRIWNPWLDRLAVERIHDKAQAMESRRQEARLEWEQLLWEELAAFMGGPVNQEAFRSMARKAPFKLVRTLTGQPLVLEALLFGVCGALSGEGDAHFTHLQQHWDFLQDKYQLEGIAPLNLRFLRLRPQAFPTLRLSQLARLVSLAPSLIQWLDPDHFDDWLEVDVQASEYWNTHYHFEEEARFGVKSLGKAQKQVLLVNVLAPLALLYQRSHGRSDESTWLETVLRALRPASNRLTEPFEALGLKARDEWESQALIQLNKHYCSDRRCVNCAAGHHLLKRPGVAPALRKVEEPEPALGGQVDGAAHHVERRTRNRRERGALA